jgi:hypothetical protein
MLPFIGLPGLVPSLFISSGRIGVVDLDMSAIPDKSPADEWVGGVKLNRVPYKAGSSSKHLTAACPCHEFLPE